MAFLNKHQVALYNDLKSKIIEVWGGQLKIRVMTIKEQQEFSALCESEKDNKAYSYFLIKHCCLGDNDERIFEDGDDDILDGKSLESISFLVDEILSLSKQNKDDVKTLAKNS